MKRIIYINRTNGQLVDEDYPNAEAFISVNHLLAELDRVQKVVPETLFYNGLILSIEFIRAYIKKAKGGAE